MSTAKSILGISIAFMHDPAACLLQNNRLVAAAEEERFIRVKYGRGHPFPQNAINFCLKSGNINFGDLDHIGLHYKPWGVGRDIVEQIPHLFRSKESFLYSMYSSLKPFGTVLEYLRKYYEVKQLCNGKGRVHFVDHHYCHAASTYFVSPFEEAVILTMDKRGEGISTTMGIGRGNKITRIGCVKNPHSLGTLYEAITKHLGFKEGDEYKVMGLASFGKPTYIETFRDMIRPLPEGRFKFDYSYFIYPDQGFLSKKATEIIGPKREKGQKINERHANIASSLQKVTEEIVFHIADYLYEKTGLTNLCIAGGVGLNCAINGKLSLHSKFKNIYVQPAAGDAGTALGSALFINHMILNQPRGDVMDHPYWGQDYSDHEILQALEISKLQYEKLTDVPKTTAQLIANGHIVGWFQGRFEWGPRALGSRSILADPTRPEMKDLINKYVKFREEFRPFAPSVLEEQAHEYFECNGASPFMLFVYPVKPSKQKILPAVTHVDGTARVHTVNKMTNPLYYRLIEEFYKLKGVPVILNTSFNVQGEPIVNTPHEAIRCFSSCGLDYLVLGNFLIKKKADS